VGVSAEHRGIPITRLMYASLLSHRHLIRHLQVLLKERLLEYDGQEKVYKITTMGLQFIEVYTKMAEMLEPIALRPRSYRAISELNRGAENSFLA
jgi:predicted transcriptional regulator